MLVVGVGAMVIRRRDKSTRSSTRVRARSRELSICPVARQVGPWLGLRTEAGEHQQRAACVVRALAVL